MIYQFEDFSLDTERHELRRAKRLVSVEPQVFDLLEYFIRNRERVVTKNDLIEAIWNGRTISDSTLSSRVTAARQAISDRGKEQRLIRTVARKGFRFVGDVREGDESTTKPFGIKSTCVTASSGKATIVVRPFANISGNPEQQQFVDGLMEDIRTELSQFCWVSVISRSVGSAHEGWAMDIEHARRDLGVRYLLDGSMRRTREGVRVTARLIETSTGSHLWAQHFDARNADIVILQEQIAANVVGTIGPKLEQIEIERARRREPQDREAVHYYLRGMGSVYRWSRDGINDALSQFHKAIQVDPGFASAYGMAAYCYVHRGSYGWMSDRGKETAECARLAHRAAQLGQGHAATLAKAAQAIAYVARDMDRGAFLVECALKLNPGLAVAWYVSGWMKLFVGQPATAIEHLTRAIRLSPFDPLAFKTHAALAYAHFFAGHYDDASAMAASALIIRPNYLTAVRAGAASHALAGRLDKARNLMAYMRKCDPTLRISNLTDVVPLCRSQDFARWAGGLHKAGLPD